MFWCDKVVCKRRCLYIYVLNRGDGSGRDQTHFTDLGELEQSAAAFHHDDAVDLSPSILFLRSLFMGSTLIYYLYILYMFLSFFL